MQNEQCEALRGELKEMGRGRSNLLHAESGYLPEQTLRTSRPRLTGGARSSGRQQHHGPQVTSSITPKPQSRILSSECF